MGFIHTRLVGQLDSLVADVGTHQPEITALMLGWDVPEYTVSTRGIRLTQGLMAVCAKTQCQGAIELIPQFRSRRGLPHDALASTMLNFGPLRSWALILWRREGAEGGGGVGTSGVCLLRIRAS